MSRVTAPEHGSIWAWRAVIIGLVILLFAGLVICKNPFVVETAKAQDFDNARVAECALAELGTTRPTGWDQPGECIKSAQRWVAEAGGYFGPGGVISGYTNSGAIQVSASQATKGDIVQWTNGNDNDWSHPHTVCIVQNHGNGVMETGTELLNGRLTGVQVSHLYIDGNVGKKSVKVLVTDMNITGDKIQVHRRN